MQEGSDDEDDDDRDSAVDDAQLARWKAKCDVMRVATYYRVTGARERAKARGRSASGSRKSSQTLHTCLQEVKRVKTIYSVSPAAAKA